MNFFRQIVLLFFILGYFSANAQNNTSIGKVLEKFTFRETNNPSATLFLHCDKTIYTNNETIWFAAYLQANRGTPIEKHHTLSVALFNEESKRINLSELYVMEAGLASGSIVLPDTIVPGNYQLMAYTNIVDKKGMPFEIFSIPLTIKSTFETKFNASIRLLDTAQNFKGTRRISIRASGIPIQRNGKYPPAIISYYTIGGETKTIQTNGDGEAIVAIDTDKLSPSNNTISASVRFDEETKYLFLLLPGADPKKINIKFYPEGGNLSDGIPSTIGFEAISVYGQPLSLRAILLKDGKPIDTVETSVSGMGSFKLTPIAGSVYTLKAFKSNLLAEDTVYHLPKSSKGFPVISMGKAVVSDTLSFLIKCPMPGNFNILIHNTHELLASFNLAANARGRHVKIALKDVPKGIATLTVLDSLGRPLVERLFFAHYTDGELLTASIDKPVYKPREKVRLRLRLKEIEVGKEEKALVSVAAVQGNRLETAKFKDMESYTYLEHELGNLPLDPNGIPYRNRKYLEDLLLIKGWRRYVFDQTKWPEKLDTAGLYQSLELSGNVTKNGKELDEPINLTLIRDTLFNVINTDTIGNLLLNVEETGVTARKKLLFIVNKVNRYGYQVYLKNPYEITNNAINTQFEIEYNFVGKTESNSLEQIYKGNDKLIQLRTVEIKNKNDDLLTKTNFIPVMNKCGDYVCKLGFLNCPMHPPNTIGTTLPVKGKNYLFHIPSRIIQRYYSGCIYETTSNTELFSLQGRLFSKEFYINDYKVGVDETLDFQSTVYWTPFLQLSSSKDTEVSFYTSDLKAPYRVIVQGISEKQVVTGSTSFKVE